MIIFIFGIYLLIVINNDNGCISDIMVVVSIDIIVLVVIIVLVDLLSCVEFLVILMVDVVMVIEFIVEWVLLVSFDDQVLVDVIVFGIYFVCVVSIINGCEDIVEVMVDGDVIKLLVIFVLVVVFDCGDEFVLIDVFVFGEEDDFDLIEWIINMVLILGENSLMLNVMELGEYSL